MKKPNDVILKTVTKVAIVVIFAFGAHVFISGHHNPGGGFIGGLIFASGLTLIVLTFDLETFYKILPLDPKIVAAIGALLALITGISGMISGQPFLNQTFGEIYVPIFGESEYATAVIFDIGVALAVIGTAMTIIINIGKDQ